MTDREGATTTIAEPGAAPGDGFQVARARDADPTATSNNPSPPAATEGDETAPGWKARGRAAADQAGEWLRASTRHPARWGVWDRGGAPVRQIAREALSRPAWDSESAVVRLAARAALAFEVTWCSACDLLRAAPRTKAGWFAMTLGFASWAIASRGAAFGIAGSWIGRLPWRPALAAALALAGVWAMVHYLRTRGEDGQ